MDILSSILSEKISEIDSKQTDFERVFWFTQIMKWVQRPRNSEEKKSKKETVYTVRLKYLLLMLDKNPEWKIHFTQNVTLLLLKISSAAQLTSAGLPDAASFIQDFFHRLQEKIIPKSPLSEDLETLIYEIFPQTIESQYIDFIEESVLDELFQLFNGNSELVNRLRSDLMTASYILSHQVCNQSLMIQKELQCLTSQPQNLHEFILEGKLRAYQMKDSLQIGDDLFHDLTVIENHSNLLYQMMKKSGVKIELVYLFQIQKRKLTRLRILLKFLNAKHSATLTFRNFISQLVLEIQHQKSLKSFFAENLTLLTDRIVQTNSHIGEHYLTHTWLDFKKMFYSALGGGGVTAVTVFIKHMLGQLNLVGFIKGLADSLNYSTSFLFIQLMGWTLATKQPSATAPFIAIALQKSSAESEKSIIALLRTQFISVIGNLSLVFPICFIFSLVLLKLGHPLVSMNDSLKIFSSTNILGPSALFAAFTGVLLFLASLFAGWFENWIIVNRIDKRIKYNDRLQKYFGPKYVERFSVFISEKANPLAANIGLGFLLGMTPQLIKFLGIPLEPRHVTLATGGFAAALPMVLQVGVNSWQLFNSIAGILLIGLLNITVSFSLAFLLASISSKVKFTSFLKLLKWGLLLILTRPWLLIIPEKQSKLDNE